MVRETHIPPDIATLKSRCESRCTRWYHYFSDQPAQRVSPGNGDAASGVIYSQRNNTSHPHTDFLENNASGPLIDRKEETRSLLRSPPVISVGNTEGDGGINTKSDAVLRQLTVFMDCSVSSALSMSAPPWAKLPFMEGLAAERAESEYHSFLFAAPQLTAHLFSQFYEECCHSCMLADWMDKTLRLGYSLQFCHFPPPSWASRR